MTKDGDPFDCRDADSLNIRFSEYTGMGFESIGNSLISLKGAISYDAGTNVCTSVNAQTALGNLSMVDGILAVYGQDELIETVGHIALAKYPFAALLTWGVDYSSAANVTGCEKCHQTPYYKHGYIRADVSAGGGKDFWTCKVCHTDNRDGGHEDWQIAVDNPMRWAEIWNGDDLTPAEEDQYAYKTRLMNDVHMSHSMEFPYPQSMRNCATCHAGKLAQTLSDANFNLFTCKSCHPVTGGTDTADGEGHFAVDTRPIALSNLLPSAIHGAYDLSDNSIACNECHKAGGIAPKFSIIHTGYDPKIYDTAGNKYADGIIASVDSVSKSGNDLDIEISATGTVGGLDAADITPIVMVSFYGYDSKDFILSNHTRDANGNRMEKTIGSANALFTEVPTGVPGTWEVILHMDAYVPADPSNLGTIPDLIADGIVKRCEVAFRPRLEGGDGEVVGLNAPSATFDLNANMIEADYFKDDNALVSVLGTEDAYEGGKGCNSCHDQLATSFHSGDRGGNIVVCRMCHVVTSGGSHLEGQSRSIDSYAHAIHRFQAFDVDEVDFDDPVEKAKYEEEIEFLFPDFATINCEACHTEERAVDEGRRLPYDVPDQSKSMPGLLSATDEIPGVIPLSTPEVVVGPAARACGACHRAEFIKENDAGGFASFNQHTKEFGFRIENDDDDNALYIIIKSIMGMFE